MNPPRGTETANECYKNLFMMLCAFVVIHSLHFSNETREECSIPQERTLVFCKLFFCALGFDVSIEK